MLEKYPNLVRVAAVAIVVVLVGLAFNQMTNRQSVAAEVLAVSAGASKWYVEIMGDGTEENPGKGSDWDKSFLPADPSQVRDMSSAADAATTTSVQDTIAWYVTPTVKFREGSTTGVSEDGNITVETADGNIKVTCQTQDAACDNVKAAVEDALADLRAARGEATE